MTKLPRTPPSVADLVSLGADTTDIPSGSPFGKIYFAGGTHPTAWDDFRYFGPTNSRFDHQLLDTSGNPHIQTRGIMYLATAMSGTDNSLATCLAEVFQHTRTIDRHRRVPYFCIFKTTRKLKFLNVKGAWITKAGGSLAISTGPRSVVQKWSQNFYDAFSAIDGVHYASSMGGASDAFALFERGKAALPAGFELNRSLADPSLQAALLTAAGKIGYQITA